MSMLFYALFTHLIAIQINEVLTNIYFLYYNKRNYYKGKYEVESVI